MATLDYQNPQDRRYERQGVLRKLFGPSQAEIWKQLSEGIDAEFVPPTFFKPAKVISEVGEWAVTLDVYTESHGDHRQSYTRLRAPYVNRDSLRFTIYRASIFTPIGKMLGMQDIETGDAAFDESHVIKGTSEARVRMLLLDRDICRQIETQKHLRIDVKDDEGWFGRKFPDGVDMLEFKVCGIVKDIDRLEHLFALFAGVLHRLCAIGSAYEDDPGIRLD